MKTGSFKLLFIFTVLFLISGCTKEELTQVQEEKLIAGDYFPTAKGYVWKYSSNAISDSGKGFIEFEMKIDTISFRRGVFKALLGRLPKDSEWGSILAIKDSANSIYSLGDNPPETLYLLFKHQYTESEVTKETITISGKTYQTLKRSISEGQDTLTFWFADGIGLVKEFSRQGISLFSDDNRSKHVTVKTELIEYSKAAPKLYPAHLAGDFE